jgi:hypothetical protein
VSDDAVERYTLGGELRWRSPLRMRELQVAERADRALGVDAEDSRRVVHLARGERAGIAEFRAPIWNLAIAPSGRFAAATTKDRLHVFDDAVLTRSIALPLAYAVSLAVSDAGALLVGGQDAQHRGLVLVYDRGGELIEERRLPVDDHAFRPRVGFDRAGAAYSVVSRSGLVRAPTPQRGAH